MINFELMTPDVYCNESRDFLLLCKIENFSFNSIKYETDSILNILDTNKIKGSFLPLLLTKLGFFSLRSIINDELRVILSIFPILIKEKGSYIALYHLFLALLKLTGSQAEINIEKVNGDIRVGTLNFDRHSILIGIDKLISISDNIQEIIKYIIPPGYNIYIYFYSKISLSDSYEYKDLNYIEKIDINNNVIGYMNKDGKKVSNTVDTQIVSKDI